MNAPVIYAYWTRGEFYGHYSLSNITDGWDESVVAGGPALLCNSDSDSFPP